MEEYSDTEKKVRSLSKILNTIEKNINKYGHEEKNIELRIIDIESKADSKQKKINDLDLEINEREQELLRINQEIELQQKSVETPLASLKEKQRLFELREKDLKTLVARLKKKWAVVYPGQTLNLD
jgi:hypothetical protein